MSIRINPYITVDCVVIGFDLKQLKVLLTERVFQSDLNQKPVYSDHSLPGCRIQDEEDPEETAGRIIMELTGIPRIYLEQFMTFANPGRKKSEWDQVWLRQMGHDPVHRMISVAYFGLLDLNSIETGASGNKTGWFPVDDLPLLAFDHAEIIGKALESLRRRIRVSSIGYLMLPKKFSLSQLQALYEVIYRVSLDKRNFRKKMGKMKYLIPLNEKQSNVSHKPAQLYMFSQEVYEITKGDFFENIM